MFCCFFLYKYRGKSKKKQYSCQIQNFLGQKMSSYHTNWINVIAKQRGLKHNLVMLYAGLQKGGM